MTSGEHICNPGVGVRRIVGECEMNGMERCIKMILVRNCLEYTETEVPSSVFGLIGLRYLNQLLNASCNKNSQPALVIITVVFCELLHRSVRSSYDTNTASLCKSERANQSIRWNFDSQHPHHSTASVTHIDTEDVQGMLKLNGL